MAIFPECGECPILIQNRTVRNCGTFLFWFFKYFFTVAAKLKIPIENAPKIWTKIGTRLRGLFIINISSRKVKRI